MSSEPTSAGEMIGFLRLDPSDWKDNSDKVKADAKELGRLNPHIRVDVDASKALAQLAAVAAATKRLQDATGNVTVAEAKLNELREKGNVSTSKLAAAEEALAKARRAEQVASINLAKAHDDVATAADKATRALVNGGSSAGLSMMSVLLPALAAVATMVGPLAAVGAAGLGTIVLGAQQATDEIKTGLTPAFSELQQVANDALGPGLHVAIGQLQQALPQLAPLVAVFGQTIGQELSKLATYLNNGGIQEFSKYAERELPIVANAFEAITVAGVKFFGVITPLGNGFLTLVTKIAEVLSHFSDAFSDFGGGFSGSKKASSSGGKSSGWSWFDGGIGRTAVAAGQVARGIVDHAHVPGTPGGPGGSGNPEVFHNGKSTPAPILNSQTRHFATNNLAAPSLNSQQLHFATNDLGAPSLNSKALQQATSGLNDPTSQALISNAAALGTTITAYGSAKDAAAQFKASTDANTLAMQLENNATGILSQALSGLNGNDLGVASSSTAFHAAVTSLNDSLKQNGDTLDINTAKGQANRQSIEQAVSAAQAHAQAVAQQTGSTKAATDAYNTDISTLEKQLGATGLAKDKIDEYITSIDKIPPLKRTQLEIDASLQVTAANLGQSVHDAINSIPAAAAKNKKADGGWIGGVGGSRSDSNLILASRGEFVVSAKYAQLYGPALQSLNSGKGLPAVAVPGKKVDVNVYPAAGMDERSVGKYTATYVESVMV